MISQPYRSKLKQHKGHSVSNSTELKQRRKRIQECYFSLIREKKYRNESFPQYFHTRKLGEITVFFTVNCVKTK